METVKREKTMGEALVIKCALKDNYGAHSVMVMAGESVCINFSLDLKQGLKFTLDQWNEIVNFVDGRILQEFEDKLPSWGPDWSKIDKRYNYYAVDRIGFAYVYTTKPDNTLWDYEWNNTEFGGYLKVGKVTLPKGVKWSDTLLTRPGVSR